MMPTAFVDAGYLAVQIRATCAHPMLAGVLAPPARLNYDPDAWRGPSPPAMSPSGEHVARA